MREEEREKRKREEARGGEERRKGRIEDLERRYEGTDGESEGEERRWEGKKREDLRAEERRGRRGSDIVQYGVVQVKDLRPQSCLTLTQTQSDRFGLP